MDFSSAAQHFPGEVNRNHVLIVLGKRMAHSTRAAAEFDHDIPRTRNIASGEHWLNKTSVILLTGAQKRGKIPVLAPGGNVVKGVFAGALVPVAPHGILLPHATPRMQNSV